MPVATRLFPDQIAAARTAWQLDALGLSSVKTSIIGKDDLPDYRDMRVEQDPVTGERTQVPEPAPGAAKGTAAGAVVGGGVGLLAGLAAATIPGAAPVAAAGLLAPAITGAAGGALTGYTIGTLMDLGIPDKEEGAFREAILHGGAAVSVRFAEEHREQVERVLAGTGSRPAGNVSSQ
ncbi:MAG: hypothetical protein ACK4HD_15010 [Pannonibacter phragmitetus]